MMQTQQDTPWAHTCEVACPRCRAHSLPRDLPLLACWVRVFHSGSGSLSRPRLFESDTNDTCGPGTTECHKSLQKFPLERVKMVLGEARGCCVIPAARAALFTLLRLTAQTALALPEKQDTIRAENARPTPLGDLAFDFFFLA